MKQIYVWFINNQVQYNSFFFIEKCGGLHSVKWYKENSRVFVYSPISNFKNAEVRDYWLPKKDYLEVSD